MHLVRKLEKIDRDLQELENIRGRVQEDRDYAGRLRESLTDESRRLKELRGRILTQVIKVPPDSDPVGNGKAEAKPTRAAPAKKKAAASAVAREPEIILPGKSGSSSRTAKTASAASDAPEQPADNGTAGAKRGGRSGGRGKSGGTQSKSPPAPKTTKSDKKDAESFQFRYE